MSFRKYLKYKTKYIELSKLTGGTLPTTDECGKAVVTAFAKEKFPEEEEEGMALDKFHKFLGGVNYYKKDPALKYDDRGIHNPMIIGNYMVRAIGHRHTMELQVRLKEETDTPEQLKQMANGENDDIDIENRHKYVCINNLSDD